MTIKTCVEKAKENGVELDSKLVQKAYSRFYFSMISIFISTLIWVLAVLSAFSMKLMFFVEICISLLFILSLDGFLRLSAESKEAFTKLQKFSKSFWVWLVFVVLSIGAIIFLKMNFLL